MFTQNRERISGAFAALVLAVALPACVSAQKKRPLPPAWQAAGAGASDKTPNSATKPGVKAKKSNENPSPRSEPEAIDPSLAVLPFPKLPKDDKGRDLIGVRVFPHPHGDPWTQAKESGASVALNGNCRSYRGHPEKPEATATALETKTRFELTPETLPKPLWFACQAPVTVERAPGVPSHRYEGAFYAHRIEGTNGKAQVELLNIVPLETYLRGVLPSEVIPSWPAETLKAQAVASRTYAYYNIAHNRIDPNPKLYDVDDTPFFQVYTGVSAPAEATDKAIEATQGVVLSYLGRVVLTFFCTDAGGHTESAQEVFGLNAPYCKAKPEIQGLATEKSAWTKTIALSDLSAKLGQNIASISVTPAQRSNSGRVRALTATSASGATSEIPAADFKKAAGVKSALFTVTVDSSKKELRLDGTGSGHGVGLSQKGAKSLARLKSWDFKRILTFYYDGAVLCALTSADGGELPRCGRAAQAAAFFQPKPDDRAAAGAPIIR